MHRINGYDIELTAGDSLFFNVSFDNRILPEGATALFTVKRNPRDEDAVLRKELPVEDNTVEVRLLSEETNIDARTYYWDIRLMFTAEYGQEVETPMEYAALTILQPIGEIEG